MLFNKISEYVWSEQEASSWGWGGEGRGYEEEQVWFSAYKEHLNEVWTGLFSFIRPFACIIVTTCLSHTWFPYLAQFVQETPLCNPLCLIFSPDSEREQE